MERISNGKILKRPAHANRIRLLREMVHDYRDSGEFRKLVMSTQQWRPDGGRTTEIVLAAPQVLRCDALILPTGWQPDRYLADAEAQLFDETVRELTPQGKALNPVWYDTPSLQAARLVFVDQSDTSAVWLTTALADMVGHPEVSTVAVMLRLSDRVELWPYAQSIALAVKTLWEANPLSMIHRIIVFTSSLTFADVLSVVFNTESAALFAPVPADNTQTIPSPTDRVAVRPDVPIVEADAPDQWVPIDRIIATKRKKGGQYFKVKWSAPDTEPSWVSRRDVTSEAIRQYYASLPQRRRRRRKT